MKKRDIILQHKGYSVEKEIMANESFLYRIVLPDGKYLHFEGDDQETSFVDIKICEMFFGGIFINNEMKNIEENQLRIVYSLNEMQPTIDEIHSLFNTLNS